MAIGPLVGMVLTWVEGSSPWPAAAGSITVVASAIGLIPVLNKRYEKALGLSDRHVHDVLIGAEHLVPDIQGELEAKR